MNLERETQIADVTENIESGHCSKHEAINNVSALGSETNIGEGSSRGSEAFRTYRRQRYKMSRFDKVREVEIAASKVHTILNEQKNNDTGNSFEKVSHPYISCHDNLNGTNNDSRGHSRKVVLKGTCQSVYVESNGGLHGFVQDAMLSHLEIDCETQECIAADKYRHREAVKLILMPGEAHYAAKSHLEAVSNGIINGFNHQTITEQCQRTFYNVITSDKFAVLCNILCENFKGIKDDNLLGLKVINKRMIEGTYEHLPLLFLQDIQQVWRKLEVIGTEVISLARSLSKMSDNTYKELVVGPAQRTSKDGKVERGDDDAQKVRTCRCCGGIPHGRDYLICDSCEDMYHVSCIEPPLKEIPSTNWYCTTCTIRGVRTTWSTRVTSNEVIHTSKETPHEVCVVCERLKAMGIKLDGSCCKSIPTNGETLEQMKSSSEICTEGSLHFCKVCGSEVVENEENLLCDHHFCPNKYYHLSCMTPEELKKHGSQWYCPSCLCRACLTDKDDDKIVICDGCDHAYHLYCMQPPRNSIPKGKWFCMECNKGNQDLHGMKAADIKQKRKCVDGSVYRNKGKKQNLWLGKSSVKG